MSTSMHRIQEDVIRMSDNEIAPEQIADALGIPISAVVTILLRADREGDTRNEFEKRFGRHDVGPETRKAIVSDYQAMCSVRHTCKRLGLSKSEYWRVLSEEGVPIRRWKAQRDQSKLRRDAELVDMYLDGVPVREIAKTLGVSLGLICAVIALYNVPRRQVKWNTPKLGEFVHPRELLDSYD